MTATKRAPLPPLVVQHPLCPICDKEVRCDGRSFWCETCHGSWASHRYAVDAAEHLHDLFPFHSVSFPYCPGSQACAGHAPP